MVKAGASAECDTELTVFMFCCGDAAKGGVACETGFVVGVVSRVHGPSF